MPTVIITPPILNGRPGAYRDILEAAGFELRYPTEKYGRQLHEPELLACLDGVDASLAGPEPYTEQAFSRFPQLRTVCRAGVGFDAVDLTAAAKHKVAVGFTPGTNHDAVAEHLFALMLGVTRHIPEYHHMVAGGGFRRQMGRPLRGRTLGIVGYGRIGRAVALRARAFLMDVIAFDPLVPLGTMLPEGVKTVSLDDLYAQSDYITLHAPATPDTNKMINETSIAKMKDGVVLINTARGTLIDEAALRAALDSGKVGAAGLDVFENEPPIGSPLPTAPNVVLTPHVASMDDEGVNQMATMAAQTIVDLHQGKWPADRLVNADVLGPNWKW